MKYLLPIAAVIFCTLARHSQEEPPAPPHVTDPANCTKYCYPRGGPDSKPKGTPDGIEGYECAGDHCGRINEDNPEGTDCDEHSGKTGAHCSEYCSKPCCTCLEVCI